MNEFIAYKGEKFTIEWYFDNKGQCSPLDYFENLSSPQKRATLKLFQRMGDMGKIFDITKFRNEGDEVYAFKPQPDRFLCFFMKGKKIIITNAFKKKDQKLPSQEKNKALKIRADYKFRVDKGEYYDK